MGDLKQNTRKLALKTLMGYGSASIADAATYNFIFIFFLFFLTNIAGVNPALAGTISLIAVLWDAITDPIMGYLSDNTTSKLGRRRLYLLVSAIPLALTVILMFSSVQFTGSGKIAYYIIVSMLFWTSYTVFYIPYFALGAEITSDYNERTKIRSFASLFNIIGNFIGMSAPMLIIGFFMQRGVTEATAWRNVSLIIGIVAMFSIFITWKATKGQELKIKVSEQKENVIKTYMQILKLKPYKFVLLTLFLFSMAYGILNADLIYFMKYKLDMGEEMMSLLFTIYLLFAVALVPIILKIANTLGKRRVMVFGFVFSGLGMILFQIIGIDNLVKMVIFFLVFGVGSAIFWQISIAVTYDISEVDEFENGTRKEGAILAIGSFIVKFGSAISMQILGIILKVTSYNPEAAIQETKAIKGIEYSLTVIPASFLLLAAIMMWRYPITKEKYNLLLSALTKKKNSQQVEKTGLERIVSNT